ncbi:MAG: hypothetical protein Q4C12_01335 [Clostridia bacterium]|nr:hypothetical protein [Clostridia bacterium]
MDEERKFSESEEAEESSGGLFSEEMAQWSGVSVPREYRTAPPPIKTQPVSDSVKRVLRAVVLAPLMVISGVYLLTYVLTEIVFPVFSAIALAVRGVEVNIGEEAAAAAQVFISKFGLAEALVSLIFALCALGLAKIKIPKKQS